MFNASDTRSLTRSIHIYWDLGVSEAAASPWRAEAMRGWGGRCSPPVPGPGGHVWAAHAWPRRAYSCFRSSCRSDLKVSTQPGAASRTRVSAAGGHAERTEKEGCPLWFSLLRVTVIIVGGSLMKVAPPPTASPPRRQQLRGCPAPVLSPPGAVSSPPSSFELLS